MTEELWKAHPLPEGYGMELVRISWVKEQYDLLGEAFLEKNFAPEERGLGAGEPDWEYLAGRLAVKKAVFKIISPLVTPENPDPRQVMTLRQPDGSPRVSVQDPLRHRLEDAGIHTLLVSITNEDDYAAAFCFAG